MTEPVRVAALSELSDGKPVRVEIGATAVCLVRVGERVHALSDVCSHADVRLSEGEVEDGTVECWLHGSRFDLDTGRPTGLPATTSGDDVLVALVAPC